MLNAMANLVLTFGDIWRKSVCISERVILLVGHKNPANQRMQQKTVLADSSNLLPIAGTTRSSHDIDKMLFIDSTDDSKDIDAVLGNLDNNESVDESQDIFCVMNYSKNDLSASISMNSESRRSSYRLPFDKVMAQLKGRRKIPRKMSNGVQSSQEFKNESAPLLGTGYQANDVDFVLEMRDGRDENGITTPQEQKQGKKGKFSRKDDFGKQLKGFRDIDSMTTDSSKQATQENFRSNVSFIHTGEGVVNFVHETDAETPLPYLSVHSEGNDIDSILSATDSPTSPEFIERDSRSMLSIGGNAEIDELDVSQNITEVKLADSIDIQDVLLLAEHGSRNIPQTPVGNMLLESSIFKPAETPSTDIDDFFNHGNGEACTVKSRENDEAKVKRISLSGLAQPRVSFGSPKENELYDSKNLGMHASKSLSSISRTFQQRNTNGILTPSFIELRLRQGNDIDDLLRWGESLKL